MPVRKGTVKDGGRTLMVEGLNVPVPERALPLMLECLEKWDGRDMEILVTADGTIIAVRTPVGDIVIGKAICYFVDHGPVLTQETLLAIRKPLMSHLVSTGFVSQETQRELDEFIEEPRGGKR